MRDIHVGTAAGSIAWVDAGACCLRARRLAHGDFLGGAMVLNGAAFTKVLQGLTDQLGLPLNDAAEDVLTILNANMANAVRSRTVQKGIDPRGFALVAAMLGPPR